MRIDELSGQVPDSLLKVFEVYPSLTPAQAKAVDAGLLRGVSMLICTPTASGKTNIGVLAAYKAILEQHARALYIVPLRALATEKFRDFKLRLGHLARVGVATGDTDSEEPDLHDKQMIICTSEKLDSLLRHHVPWLKEVAVIVVDEVHLLNDQSRGPTLEVILTLLRQVLPKIQIIALSATIGNPHELATWLDAALVEDTWRPIRLEKGVFWDDTLEFFDPETPEDC